MVYLNIIIHYQLLLHEFSISIDVPNKYIGKALLLYCANIEICGRRMAVNIRRYETILLLTRISF